MIKILDYLFIFYYYYFFKQCQDHEILAGTYDVSGRYYLGIITITIIIAYQKKKTITIIIVYWHLYGMS